MEYKFELRPYDDEIRAAYLELLPEQSDVVNDGKLDWKFADNPHGQGQICVATREDGRIVGLNAFMACGMLGDPTCSPDSLLLGRQSMDTIVSPEARGQGLFTQMFEAFYRQSGDAFVYGFPSVNSAPGLFGKLGWSRLGDAPIMIRPLRTKYFASKFKIPMPDLKLLSPKTVRPLDGQIQRFESWVDIITNDFLKEKPNAIFRNHSYLNWRFVDNPAFTYECFRSEQSFLVRNLLKKHDGMIGYIMECMGEEHEMDTMLRSTVYEMAERGADALLSWCLPSSPNYRAYRKAGFFPMPARLRPFQLHWGIRPLIEKSSLMDQNNWYLSYCDSDTV